MDDIEAFWQRAQQHARLVGMPSVLGVNPLATLRPPAWSFGATPEHADSLLELVLEGTKTATASALWDYEAEGEELPSVGTLSIITDGAGVPRALLGVTRVRTVPFGEVVARATRLADGELVTKVDDDDFYGPEHVWDLVLAHRFSGAQVVGKRAEYVHLEEAESTVHRKVLAESYVHVVAGGTLTISVADLRAVGGWRPVPRSVDRGLLERVRDDGGLVYATHGLGYLYVRHGRGHTWTVDDSRFLTGNLETWSGREDRVLEAPVPDFVQP